MKIQKIPRLLIALSLTFTLLLGSCGTAPNSAPEPLSSPAAIAPDSTAVDAAPQAAAIAEEETVTGGSLNAFFPASDEEFERVFVQEKVGFSQAKLKQGGEELGLLSINDLANNLKALDKFKASSETLAGYPLVTVGSTQTALLVGDRYQVKVKSNSDSLTPEDRKTWLEKFDLTGLEALE